MATEVLDETQFNNVPDVDLDTIPDAVKNLVMIAEPINGPNTFNLETAAYGYITRDERLIVPSGLEMKMPNDVNTPVNLNIIELMSIAMPNYIRLKRASLSDDHAMFVAVYRARLVSMGYLLRTKEQRCVTVNEVDYSDGARDHHGVDYAAVAEYKTAFDAANSDKEKLKAYIEHGTAGGFKKFIRAALLKTDMFRFLTIASNQLAASSYLVFRQMGHHFKPELDAKYNVLWKATTLESPSYMPSNSVIHRVAIHSFGMYALHEKFFQNLEAGTLAETYADRADVTPCGAAVINTCWASISLMKSLPVWNGLYAAYKTQIDHLESQAKLLRNAKEAIKYHKNAKLFGAVRGKLDPTSAYALAPVAKGFLEAMDDTADIKRQKTLDKRASQNPAAVALVTNVIIGILNRVSESSDLSKALPSSTSTAGTSGTVVSEVK